MVYLPCHCFRPTQCIGFFVSLCFTVLRNTTQRMSRMVRSFLFIFLCIRNSTLRKSICALWTEEQKVKEIHDYFWWRMNSSRIPIAEKENGWCFFLFNFFLKWNKLFILSAFLHPRCIDACECECVFRWFIIYIISLWRAVYYLVKESRQVKKMDKEPILEMPNRRSLLSVRIFFSILFCSTSS